MDMVQALEGNGLIGEASVWYLYSDAALNQIKVHNPNARVIAMVRNPWEMLPALHAQFLVDADETEMDLNKTIGDELEGRIPSGARNFEQRPAYMGAVHFAPWIDKWKKDYGDAFHCIVLDDLRSDPEMVYHGVCQFLGLDPNVEIDFRPQNLRKSIKSAEIQRLVDRPSERLKKIIRTAIPSKAIRHALMVRAKSWNTGSEKAQELSNEIRERIRPELDRGIRELEQVLNRKLNWQ